MLKRSNKIDNFGYLTMSTTRISLKVKTIALGPVAEGRQNASEAATVPLIIKNRGFTLRVFA